MNILIVDDLEGNRYLLEALLKGNGHTVVSLKNGAEALEVLKSGDFDLIISDILMPVMDGFQLCRTIKTDPSLASIPFIIYTATYTGPKDEAFAAKIGADRFIVKPCEPDVFMAAVRNVMASAKRNGIAPAPPQEEEILKLYNERLVRKLEQKMLQLEKEVEMRQQVEKILRVSEEKYRSILDNIEDGYYEVDIAGNLTFFNQSACRILGYSSDELMGINNRVFMDTENAQEVFHTFNHVFTTGEPSRGLDWVLTKKNGTLCHVNTSVSLIRNDSGNAVGFRGIMRDVTEQRNVEKEKIRLMEQLYQAQKMESMGRLAGGVAHDFNNMLGVIIGYTELVLGKTDAEDPRQDDLNEVFNAACRARDITRQLLAFSRQQIIAPRPIDLNAVIGAMLNMLRRLIGEDIGLVWFPGEELWPVLMDASQVDQILVNLCVNARDAIKDVGKITIKTRNAVIEEDDCMHHAYFVPGKYVMLVVSDDGCGMDSETAQKIFEPFFTTKEVGKGTGLGLATLYGIVKQNNGFVNVYSEPGGGATFSIYLPRHEGPLRKGADAGPAPLTKGRGETVLAVEDESAILNIIKRILESLGYQALTATSPKAAIQLERKYGGEIHLLMTDVVMPGMNGLDLAGQIRKTRPGIKCLFMSGYTADAIAHHGVLEAGVQFIQKPFSARDMAIKIRAVLKA